MQNFPPKYITHFTTKQAWSTALSTEIYCPLSLKEEGFIHCSTIQQVVGAANRYAKGQKDILLLLIEVNLLEVIPIWENTVGGTELFPHLYAPLPIHTVVQTYDFPYNKQGMFYLPEAFVTFQNQTEKAQ